MSRIFLVDDHALVLDGVRAMVVAGGHEVVGVAHDPTTALARLIELEPQVLLLDLALAEGRSGLEILVELRRRQSRVRTLVLTMSVQARDVGEALRLGAAGYLLKSCTRAELLRAIDAVASGRRHFGPEVDSLAVDAVNAALGLDPLSGLSPRERQIIARVAKGATSVEIGLLLGLSPKTVDTYRSRLMAKLGLADITSLVRFAVRVGLIGLGDD